MRAAKTSLIVAAMLVLVSVATSAIARASSEPATIELVSGNGSPPALDP